MLTQDEQNYLDKIPADKKVVVKPYDPKTTEIVEEYINKIMSVEPELDILHLGAAALKISGQGDIDISILCPNESFSRHAENLKNVLGEPVSGKSTIFWQFEKGGHEVEICLADPDEPSTARQLKVHKILNQNPKLLDQYEQLKESAASQSYREYQRQKYEFYNRILGAHESN